MVWQLASEHMPVNFRSKLHLALLQHYFANPRAEYYVRELSRKLSFSGTYVSRELRALARAGIFISSKHGQEKYYHLNKNYSLYDELRKIIKQL